MRIRRRSCPSFRSFDGGRGQAFGRGSFGFPGLLPDVAASGLASPVFIAAVLWIRAASALLFLQMKLWTYSDVPLMHLCPEFLLPSFQGIDLWIVPNWNNKTFNSVTMLFLLGTYWYFYNEEVSFCFNLETFLLGYWSNTIHLLSGLLLQYML